jgi:hypothetical protein
VKRSQRAKAALPAKLPRSTTAISKTLRSGKTIDTLVKSRTVKAEPKFAQMTERLRELGRKLGFSQCFMYIALFGFSTKQMIQLQGVNKLFYTRVAQWIRVVINFPTIRLSKPVSINTKST